MYEVIEYLEIHVHNGCNLRCRGCSHFSNLLSVDDVIDHQQFCYDIVRIKQLLPSIRKIRLLGGEPLLDKHLIKHITLVRENYPDSQIAIATNGLLIPSASENLLLAMRLEDISFEISVYPPTKQLIDSIHALLKKYGIRYKEYEVTSFRKKMTLEDSNDPVTSFENCSIGRKCHFLNNGKLAVCPAPILSKYFSDAFGVELNCDDDLLDIYDENMTNKSVVAYLNSPMKCCSHCGKTVEFPWSAGGEILPGDWLSEPAARGY